jgi:hypothetical protein
MAVRSIRRDFPRSVVTVTRVKRALAPDRFRIGAQKVGEGGLPLPSPVAGSRDPVLGSPPVGLDLALLGELERDVAVADEHLDVASDEHLV